MIKFSINIKLWMLCLFTCLNSLSAQKEQSSVDTSLVTDEEIRLLLDEEQVRPDTLCNLYTSDAAVNIEKVSDAKIEQFKKDKDLQYDVEAKNEVGWLRRLRYWFNKQMRKIFGNNNVESGWSLMRVLLLLAVSGLAIFTLIKMRRSRVFSESPRSAMKMSFEEIEENLLEVDIDERIERAVKNGQYRKAVRLYYLKTLKLLTGKELIDWEINKTNGDYRYELKGSGFEKGFEEITSVFDYVWYGEFPIDKSSFEGFKKSFVQFHKNIK